MSAIIRLLCLLSALASTASTPLAAATLIPHDSLDLRIPVLDMQDFYHREKRDEFLDTFYHALTEIGFFAVRNTGVNRETIRQAYHQAALFFKGDPLMKQQCLTAKSKGQRGFVPGEIAKGSSAKDYKEFYHIGREMSASDHKRYNLPANVWPPQSGFEKAMTSLYNELEQYVTPLQEAIVAVINRHAATQLSLSFFNELTHGGDTLLRALYYPALTQEQLLKMDEPIFWAAAHTDIDLLSILPYSTAKGLQIEMNGQWLNVIVPEDAFVVNVGDMLENITNGLFRSARHRVLAQEPNRDRFSMVLFVHPVDEASLTPLASCIAQTGGKQIYAPGTRKEFLWERLLELNIAPGLLEAYAKTGHTERQIIFGRQSSQVVDMLFANNLASPEVKACKAKLLAKN